jgi:hypothetical protein
MLDFSFGFKRILSIFRQYYRNYIEDNVIIIYPAAPESTVTVLGFSSSRSGRTYEEGFEIIKP